MAQRVFVSVVGFSDVERHALNSLFRLSEDHQTVYSLWEPKAPEPARLALIDGQSYEARVELESPRNAGVKIMWVGSAPPPNVWRTFERPLSWPDVVWTMDELFTPPEQTAHFDLDFDAVDTQPPDTLPPDAAPPRRALIASADRDERLYLRARLALADLTQADDAQTAAEALELVRDNDYAVALVDFGLPAGDGWEFLKELAGGKRAIRTVIVTKSHPALGERLHAWFAGVTGFFDKPPHPAKLHELLRRA